MHHKYQKGMGLAEVLVSLILISVGLLGFVAMQLKATQTSMDNLSKVKATIIALDFSEKLRTNPIERDTYFTAMATTASQVAGKSINCNTAFCSPSDKAKSDVYQTYVSANNNGMTMALSDCPITTTRKCLFIAWDRTTPTKDGSLGCTVERNNKMSYRDGASCIVMETY